MNSYAGCRVLVIGGLGFIGSHLTRKLNELGADVTVMTLSLARHPEIAAELQARRIAVVEGDLRDPDAVARATAQQHVIFNVAGQSGAVQSMQDPWSDLDVNCRGNLVLLEALRIQNPSPRLVFVSSRLAYGASGTEPVAEDHPVDPLCVHAVHKIAVEHYLKIYQRLFGVSYTIARLTNPYGPGQPADRTAYGIVNRFIHLALEDKPLPVYGDGAQRRDYIHVEDAVAALVKLGELPQAANRTFNVGSGAAIPLVEMAKSICDIAGGGRIQFVPWPEMAGHVETGDFVADIARIRREIGWEPRIALRDGLERTVAFYRAHAA